MDLGIKGRRALVTGASSGLGLATARALAANGVSVVIASRSRERLDTAAGTIAPSDGATVYTAVADVSAQISKLDARIAAIERHLPHTLARD